MELERGWAGQDTDVRDCLAWRQRRSALIVSADAFVRRRVQGNALDVLHEDLTWQPRP